MAATGRVKSALDVVSSIAVILAALVLIWALVIRQPGAPQRQQQVEQVEGLRIDAARVRHSMGSGRAAIVEFSDFQCPFCRRHARETLPTILHDLVDPGKARYIALHYPLEDIHPSALQASEAAECAARQDRFWEMHERLFAAQGALATDDLLGHALELGLDTSLFRRCLDEDETLENVRADFAEGRRLGVVGTPSFFIGTVRDDGGIDLVRRIRGVTSADLLVGEVSKLDSP